MESLTPELVNSTPPTETAQAEKEEHRFNELLPLQREIARATAFPVDALGEILEQAALAIHEAIQAPVAICAQSVLAASAQAVQGHADVEIDGRTFPVSEFFLTIGETGERKTAVDNVALWPQRKYQDTLRKQYQTDFASFEIEQAAYKKAYDQALNKKGTADDKKTALELLGKAPQEPLLPIILAEEPTLEGLQRMLSKGQASIGLFSDEGGRFVGGHGMNKDNQLKSVAGYCSFWDGKPMTRVRAGDGSMLLYGRRVSLHLMIQPTVAQQLLGNDLLRDQGFLSRCLITYPESTTGSRKYREINLSTDPALQAYSRRLLTILEERLPVADGERNELEPRRLKLDPEAKQSWIKFHNYVEDHLADGKLLASVRGFANKAPEHAARLAGILAVISEPNAHFIKLEHIRSGIALMNHYLNEALRISDASVADEELRLAAELLDWLLKKHKKIISEVEIYKCGPRKIRTKKKAEQVMITLAEHGYVRRSNERTEFDGQWRKINWEIRDGL